MKKLILVLILTLLTAGVAFATPPMYGGGSGGSMTYPDAGVPVSTGAAWDTSLTTDGSGDCASGAVCLGDHTHTVYTPLIRYETDEYPAEAMTACIVNPAEAKINPYASNALTISAFAFDSGATEECVQFKLAMPENWDLGTIKAKFFWSSATGSTAGDTVEFGLQCQSIRNDDPIDSAFGTAQVITDTLLANNGGDGQETSATPAITVGGTPAVGAMNICKIYRNTDGTDDMTEDAWLFRVRIQYSTSGNPSAW